MGRVGLPAPSPPPVRTLEAATTPPSASAAPPRAPRPPQSEPSPLPPAPPGPTLVKPPPPATSPPGAPQSPSPPRILGQQVNSEDEKRIQGDAQRRIEKTERLVKQIDPRRLAGDQHQNLLTVQSFLVKAREALSEKDVQRALTLADKAVLLAEELVKAVR
jgi:hypothetical protein